MSTSPTIAIFCSRYAKTSEAWLRRQAQMLHAAGRGAVEPRVLCWIDHRGEGDADVAMDPPVTCLNASTWLPKTFARRVQRLLGTGGAKYFASVGPERPRVQAWLRDVRPAAALVHFGHMGLRVLPVCEDAGVPLVCHFHGADMSSALRSARYVRALRETIPRFAALVCVAEYMRSELRRLGAPDEKIHVIPLGAPVDRIPPRPPPAGEAACRFIAVGRFVPKKAPLTTLRAFVDACERMPAATLTMLGEGPLWDEAKAIVAQRGLEARVQLAGPVPPARVREELARADVLVQHSVTSEDGDKEGWPISIAEAMAGALPIIATRHAGIVDQVVEGETGLLVDEHDQAGMSEAMIRLAGDRTARARMGEAGRARAVACFGTQRQVALLEGVLLRASGRASAEASVPGSTPSAGLPRHAGAVRS